MEPENLRFGGGSTVTVLHPLVAVAMVLAIVLTLVLPRKYVIAAVLPPVFLIPYGQAVVLAGLHFNVYRIIILAGLARWAISGRSSPLVGGFNFMDRICTAFFLVHFIINNLLYMQTQAVIKNTGDLLDVVGGYFVMRFLIRDREDIRRALKVLGAVAVICAACMLNEQRTGENIFGILGGMPIETLRDGKIRSNASFQSFLTAGAFGATLVPLFIWLWSQAKCRMIGAMGLLAATVRSITCYASTTQVAYAAGILGLCLWPIRNHLRPVRWGIVGTLMVLHFVMNGPVWSIIEHIDLTGSSTSYHRYMLIDNFIRHFSDWWALGTKDNGSWGFDMWDTSNQYVGIGFTGGLLSFVLFVTIISRSFSRLGIARRLAESNRSDEWLIWSVGAALFSHVVVYFGVQYFDQMMFGWLVLLAIISVAVFEVTSPAVAQVQEVEPRYDVYGRTNDWVKG